MKNDIKRPSLLFFHSVLAFLISFAILAFEKNPAQVIIEMTPHISIGVYFLYVMLRQIVFLAFGIYIYNLCENDISGALYICYFLLVSTFLSDVCFVALKLFAFGIAWQAVAIIYSLLSFALSKGSVIKIRALCVPMVIHSVFVLAFQIYSVL